MLDVAVIGGGPAGLTAGIYLLRAGFSVKVYDKTAFGGKIAITGEVDNYPGFEHVTGFELALAMRKHAEGLGVSLELRGVSALSLEDGHFLLAFENETVPARAVVYAAGGSPKPLSVPGEPEFLGRGVSYCATCDGAFFRKRATAVVGGGNTAVEDALYLAAIAEKVYLIHRRDEFRAEKYLVSKLLEYENIIPVLSSTVTEIAGGDVVESVGVRSEKTGERRNLPVSGVFVAVGSRPETALIKNLADLSESGRARASEDTATRTPGLFVAGDCREKPLYQIVTAVSDGGNAAASAIRYLQNQ